MTTKIPKRRLTLLEWIAICATVFIVGHVAYDSAMFFLGSRDGTTQANTDISAGTPRLFLSGRRYHLQKHIREILVDNYGIQPEFGGRCCPRTYDWAFIASYNARIETLSKLDHPTFKLADLYNLAKEHHQQEINGGPNRLEKLEFN